MINSYIGTPTYRLGQKKLYTQIECKLALYTNSFLINHFVAILTCFELLIFIDNINLHGSIKCSIKNIKPQFPKWLNNLINPS